METQAPGPVCSSLLLLEGDWDHRNVVRDFLQHRGWTVREATQAASAQTLVASESIDAPPKRRPTRATPMGSRRHAQQPEPGSSGVADKPRPLILLLDDDDDARAIYRDMLDFAGYEVITASDGMEGLRCAEARAPDVVVTDLHMPGMSGVDVARTLREEPAPPTIIAVTADSLGVDAAKQLVGDRPLFDEVLVKPLSPGELLRRVRAYVPPPEDAAG